MRELPDIAAELNTIAALTGAVGRSPKASG